MESYAFMFGAFALGLAASVLIKKKVKKGIPLSKDTIIPSLGISLNERDRKLLGLAGVSFVLCVLLLVISQIMPG